MTNPMTSPSKASRRKAFALLSSGWRLWLPAVFLVLLSAIVTQDLDHWLVGRVPNLWYLLVHHTLGGILMVVPILLYVRWRRTAQKEKSAHEQLQAAVQLREDLTNMLVHDLKQPIISAGMALNLLKRLQFANSRDMPKERDLLKMALDSWSRLDAMVQSILDVARAEGTQMPLDVTSADLVAVVRRGVQGITTRADERSLQVIEQYPPGPLMLHMDSDKIHRVVTNLLENAIKFTPDGGHIVVSVELAGTEARVTVRDSGEGIPEALQSRIFERFSQGAAAQRAHGRSVGLGLTFCKLAVEAHSGRIRVESATGQGSAFTFALPLLGCASSDA